MSLVLPRAIPARNGAAHTTSILIVDPTSDLMESISGQLGTDGYHIRQAADGERALSAFTNFRPDLILLETQLAKVSGLDVLREIRRISDVPTIIVTTRADEADRVVGLELGADDFLAKPCSPRELLARIAALLRRSRCECGNIRSLQAPQGTHDNLTIDRNRRQVMRGDEFLNLTATEFRILDALASNADQTLTRGQLLDMVGRDSAVFDRTLDKHIANLRKKIEANASHPRYLITIFGVGYRFCT